MLTKDEFDILVLLMEAKIPMSQRDIVKGTELSFETVHDIMQAFVDKDYCRNGIITESGIQVLDKYRVQRAIFLAAGFGSRMVPITFNTPKPLVRVNGERIIDSLLDAVVAAEIPEIIIVRGYLGEQFDQLRYKYPRIQFVENPIYNESNNISSAVCVRYLMQNSYVLESDLILRNPSLICKYEYQSNFLGIPVKMTDDWCFHTDGNGIITSEEIGGINCHQMVGISYWNSEDGIKLANDLHAVYNSPGGKERYWEQTALLYKKENYKIAIRECSLEDVIEIDTYNELKKVDKLYAM